jgi:hypothetical protein
MDSESVFKYIQEVGYRTLDEVKAQFSGENEEILNAVLEFLITKNKTRRANFESPKGKAVLFYLPLKE